VALATGLSFEDAEENFSASCLLAPHAAQNERGALAVKFQDVVYISGEALKGHGFIRATSNRPAGQAPENTVGFSPLRDGFPEIDPPPGFP
jgi:hypothetical protein